MKKFTAVISLSTLVLSSLLLFSNKSNKEVKPVEAGIPSGYYNSITSSMKGETLKVALYNIIKGHTVYDYDNLEIPMKATDRNWERSPDPEDENPYMNLLYMVNNDDKASLWNTYHGTGGMGNDAHWNKEHIWAKANGFPSESAPAYSDLHHLRASDKLNNGWRSNFAFSVVSGSYSLKKDYNGDDSGKLSNDTPKIYEPIDRDKGDVARALFYMATRYYNGDGSSGTNLTLTTGTDASGGKWGYLDTLLAWHEADPVDNFEIHRNDLIYSEYQHNRNPYIDHPEYARAVFKNEAIVEPDTLINLTYTGSPTKTSYKEGEVFNPNGLTVTATFQKEDSSTYTTNVTNDVSWSALTSSSTSVTGTYDHSGVEMQVTVNGITVISLTGLSIEGTLTKTVYEEGDTFDPTGLTLYADYSDNSHVDVTSEANWPTDPLVKGQLTITVTYGGQELTFPGIHVKEKQVSAERVEFGDHSSDSNLTTTAITNKLVSGGDLVSITTATNIYGGQQGIRVSTSSAGLLKITLKVTSYVSKLEFYAAKWTNDSNVTVSVTTSASSTAKTFNPVDAFNTYEISVGASISDFTITSPGKNRFYLRYIDITMGTGPAPSDDPITTWGEDYLFIGDSAFDGEGTGLCKTGNYYHAAKVALFALESSTSGTINSLRTNSKYEAELARYTAWSAANFDDSPFLNDYSFLNKSNVSSFNDVNNSNTLIILIVSLTTGISFLTILLVIKKRRVRQ